MSDNDSASQHIFQSRVQAPLLWVLVPVLIGYAFGKYLPLNNLPFWITLLGFILLGTWGWFWIKNKINSHYNLLGITGVVLISWTHYLHCQPEPLAWARMPDREAEVSVKIDKTLNFNDKYSRFAGFGTIVDAPPHLQDILGKKTYYLLRPEQGIDSLTRTEVVRCVGVLSSLNNTNIEALQGFDAFLKNQGAVFRLQRGKILSSIEKPSLFYKACHALNQKFEHLLNSNQKESFQQEAAVYTAILLGNKSYLSGDQKESYKRSGSLHLFAISGLHVGIIAAFLAIILNFCRVPTILSAIIGLILLYLYVQITGGAASAMRAYLMVAFYWGARAFYRKNHGFSALLGSALVAIVVSPNQLWDIGFQLSYTVVAMILLYGLPANELACLKLDQWLDMKEGLLYRFINKSGRWIIGIIGVSVAAALGSTPLSILYFEGFSPGGILMSIVLVPMATWVMGCGCLAIVFGLLGVGLLCSLFNYGALLCLRAMEWFIDFSIEIPGVFLETQFKINTTSTILLILLLAWSLWVHATNKLAQKRVYWIAILILGAGITLF